MTDNLHIPVMLGESISNLEVLILRHLDLKTKLPSKVWQVFDGTLGGGGYTIAIIALFQKYKQNYQLYACDLDSVAIDRVGLRLQEELGFCKKTKDIPGFITKHQLDFGLKSKLVQEVCLIQGNFADVVNQFLDGSMDYLILDLGFSSNQLELDHRGLSYLQESDSLDLRYDQDSRVEPLWLKLKHIKGHQELTKVLFNSSGEKLSPRIAGRIIEARGRGTTLETVADLVAVVTDSIPKIMYKNRYGILSRVWQALRIWVNGEFEALEAFLPISQDKLVVGGRLAIVSFHSLEDKIVAKNFRLVSQGQEIDDYGNKEFDFKHLTARALLPLEAEIEANARSRSATMRTLERV
ncbi:MAG: 16S rRNA (cytosine(1402)-N(4))-methyltransferase [Candidatus Parcubacteria bacterium]|nr:16S rRNA (cytosine(1402)-N(4))-methyltransferase [Candidatus Paceibacterota bacterium]